VQISKYWKAIAAAVAAGAGSLSVAVQDNQVTSEEWWTAAVAVLATLGLTWAVPNKPATAKDIEE
jgi:peptidoglycan/LPS O-acetylase OafA/YrhL